MQRRAASRWGSRVALVAVLALGCAGPADSYEFVYGPLSGAESTIFERLQRAVTERGSVILEADAVRGRLVVGLRSPPVGAERSRVIFQCYRGGYVRSTVEDAEVRGGAQRRIRMLSTTRTEYEALAVGLLDALEHDPGQGAGLALEEVAP